MKKLHELTLGAAFALFALSACTNEAELLPDAPQTNESDNPDACVLAAKDFRWEGNESRTALTIEENVAKFSWTPGDQVGILPDAGAQVYFTIPEPEEGVELTDEQRRKASFDGGAWALKATSNYAAYYPFIKDFDLQRTAVPVDYTGQKQTGNNNAAHLGAYDYMGARPVQTNENGGGVTFDFDHVGALVILKFTVPEAGTQLKSVTLSADGATFTTQGTYDLTSAEGFPITTTKTAAELAVEVDYTTTQPDEEVTVYLMAAPVDLSDKTVHMSVAYGTEGGNILEYAFEGKNLQAAGGYLFTAKQPVDYLTFTAASVMKMMVVCLDDYELDPSLQYSVGGGAWTQLAADEEIEFGGEQTLRLRGQSAGGTAENDFKYAQITFVDAFDDYGNPMPVAASGDIRTLVDYARYQTADTSLTANARFCFLFAQCIQLTAAPALPATTLADYCYSFMFYGCTDLTAAPDLPAITLAEGCYYYMFEGCTGLTAAPALPATTLAEYCYCLMFSGCTSLSAAPALRAETLVECCYTGMFSYCTSLTAAPALRAETLAKFCYSDMFYGCTNLNSVTMLATDISASGCLDGWLDGVSATGTFTKAAGLVQGTGDGQIPTGISGIPEGWTVVDFTE